MHESHQSPLNARRYLGTGLVIMSDTAPAISQLWVPIFSQTMGRRRALQKSRGRVVGHGLS